jgi:hypothetical protein
MILSEKRSISKRNLKMSAFLTRPLHAGLDTVVQMFHLGGEGHRAEIFFYILYMAFIIFRFSLFSYLYADTYCTERETSSPHSPCSLCQLIQAKPLPAEN